MFLGIVRNIKRMIVLLWKNNKKYLLYSITQIISGGLSPFVPVIFLEIFIDTLMVNSPLSELIRIIIYLILIRVCLESVLTVSDNFVKLYAKAMMVPLAAMFSKKSVEMDYQYTEDQSVLEKMNRASAILVNGENLEQYLGSINGILISFMQILVTFAILVKFHTLIFVMVLLLSLITSVVHLLVQKKNHILYQRLVEIDRKWKYILSLATEITYAKTIRLFSLGDFIIKKSEENVSESLPIHTKKIKNNRRANSFEISMDVLLTGGLFIWLVKQIYDGLITIGSFMLLISSAQQLSNAINTLFVKLIELFRNDYYISDFFDFLNLESNLRSNQGGEEVDLKQPHKLELINVSFQYPGSDCKILENINLCIEPGEHLGIVGENGAGKSTLIKLILRLYDVTEGEILYNGVNIKQYDYDSYMSLFSTVFQDYHIFSLDIYENLCFKADTCDRKDELDALLEQINLISFVKSLKKGGFTVLSKRFDVDGIQLSGGQSQTLAFGRALYKNSPFVILDEPTASLSPLAESRLYGQFDSLIKHKSAVFISHRLGSSTICDKICLLENGKIAEYGSHKELLRIQGLYANMYELQSKYYKEDPI